MKWIKIVAVMLLTIGAALVFWLVLREYTALNGRLCNVLGVWLVYVLAWPIKRTQWWKDL